MAGDVPLARHQRAVGGAIEHLREASGSIQGRAPAERAPHAHALAEQDECNLQVLERFRTQGAVQGSLERGEDREASRGSRRPRGNHCCEGTNFISFMLFRGKFVLLTRAKGKIFD